MSKIYTLILGSGSPRRADLLTRAGIPFEVMVPAVPEIRRPKESPDAYVKRLSFEKSEAVLEMALAKGSIDPLVMSADTIVYLEKSKKILEKPESIEDAMRMLKLISGKTHIVFTGVSIRSLKKEFHFQVKTKVELQKLSDADCKWYLDQGESMDKAGAYAAQGVGMTLVKRITGSYTNVVGLPMVELIEVLNKKYGIKRSQRA